MQSPNKKGPILTLVESNPENPISLSISCSSSLFPSRSLSEISGLLSKKLGTAPPTGLSVEEPLGDLDRDLYLREVSGDLGRRRSLRSSRSRRRRSLSLDLSISLWRCPVWGEVLPILVN